MLSKIKNSCRFDPLKNLVLDTSPTARGYNFTRCLQLQSGLGNNASSSRQLISLLMSLSILLSCKPQTRQTIDQQDTKKASDEARRETALIRPPVFLLTEGNPFLRQVQDEGISELQLASESTFRERQGVSLSSRELSAIVGEPLAQQVRSTATARIFLFKPRRDPLDPRQTSLVIQLYPQVIEVEEVELVNNLTKGFEAGSRKSSSDLSKESLSLTSGNETSFIESPIKVASPATVEPPSYQLSIVSELELKDGNGNVLSNLDRFDIHAFTEERQLVSAVEAYVRKTNQPVKINVSFTENSSDQWQRYKDLEGLFKTVFHQDMEVAFDKLSSIKITPAFTESVENGITTRTYSTGFIEEINLDKTVTRRYPGGQRTEIGTFSDGILQRGQIRENGQITYYNPKVFAESGDALSVIEHNKSLAVVTPSGSGLYASSKGSLFETIYNIGKESTVEGSLFEHPEFKIKGFIDFLAENDSEGVPRYHSIKTEMSVDLWKAAQNNGVEFPTAMHNQYILSLIKDYYSLSLYEDLDDLLDEVLATQKHTLTTDQIIDAVFSTKDGMLIDWAAERYIDEVDDFNLLKFRIIAQQPEKISLEDFNIAAKSFSRQQVDELYRLAYEYDNLDIFEKAPNPVSPKEYAINFMWINQRPLDEKVATNLLGVADQDLDTKLFNQLEQWAEKQPQEARLNFWYDSQMVPEATLKKTQHLLNEKMGDRASQFVFRDIREIDYVKANPFIFSSDVEIYYRVDLLKAMIGDHVMTKDKMKYSVTVDADVGAVSSEHLFDRRSVEYLDKGGFIFGKKGVGGFENSFMILHKEAKGLVNTHRELVIERALGEVKSGAPLDAESVFNYYPRFENEILKRLGLVEEVGEGSGVFRSLGHRNGFRKPMYYPDSRFDFGGAQTHKKKFRFESVETPKGGRIFRRVSF